MMKKLLGVFLGAFIPPFITSLVAIACYTAILHYQGAICR
jgi:hypothetical protein